MAEYVFLYGVPRETHRFVKSNGEFVCASKACLPSATVPVDGEVYLVRDYQILNTLDEFENSNRVAVMPLTLPEGFRAWTWMNL